MVVALSLWERDGVRACSLAALNISSLRREAQPHGDKKT